jgi:riboflavin synthase
MSRASLKPSLRFSKTRRPSGGVRLRIGSSLARELAPGDSLAVNGVCLTVIQSNDAEVHADVGPETLRVTTLGTLPRGALVNLERPLRAESRFGGHFVQGHVDAMGRVEELRADEDFHWLTVSFSSRLAPYLVPKGWIAIDGISLTVAGCTPIAGHHGAAVYASTRTCINTEIGQPGMRHDWEICRRRSWRPSLTPLKTEVTH